MSNNVNPISEAIKQARFAAPYSTHERGPGLEPRYLPKPAAVLRTLNMSSTPLPSLFDKAGRMIAAPVGALAGEVINLDAALIKASRVAKSGAHILIRDNQLTPIPVGATGDIVLAEVPSTFSTIEPVAFANVADDAEVEVTESLPIHRATMDWSTAQNVSVRLSVPRIAQKQQDRDLFAAELMISLTLGLARAADRLLLEAIVATEPDQFTLAAVASQGLKADELRALVGTDAIAAEFRADGQLVVKGISAELTADSEGTVMGAWDRAGVAIGRDISLIVERTKKNGDLDLTCWAHMVPLLPDASKFWSVSAE